MMVYKFSSLLIFMSATFMLWADWDLCPYRQIGDRMAYYDGQPRPIFCLQFEEKGLVYITDAQGHYGAYDSFGPGRHELIVDRQGTTSCVMRDRQHENLIEKDVKIRSAVTLLGNEIPVTVVDTFSQTTNPITVDIPDSVTGVVASAFSSCPNLRSIRFPSHLNTLSSSVCSGCVAIDSVSLSSEVTEVGTDAFRNCLKLGVVELPGVKSIGYDAFAGCANIRSVTILPIFKMSEVFPNAYKEIVEITLPDGVEKICDFSFTDCRHLRSINIPEGVTEIGESAFENCRRLESITIPKSVKKIGDYAFYGCGALKEIKYLGEKPEIGLAAFVGTSIQGGGEVATLEIKNATVHYVLRSNNPDIAVPLSEDTGFVNVITEVKGGAVSVPSTWASNYPTFTQKFGDDFLKALMKPTGKIASDGSAMLVWQDYVAGTDPTKQSDTFTASITMVDGKVKVSYSPEFEDDRKDMRKYTTLGKRQLQDVDWVEIPPGEESNYNFFKVTVEMK